VCKVLYNPVYCSLRRRRDVHFIPCSVAYAELRSRWDKFVLDESAGRDRHSRVTTDMAWQFRRKCCWMVSRQSRSYRHAAETLVKHSALILYFFIIYIMRPSSRRCIAFRRSVHLSCACMSINVANVKLAVQCWVQDAKDQGREFLLVINSNFGRNWSYLAPFLRYGDLLAENCKFFLPHSHLTTLLGVNPFAFLAQLFIAKTRVRSHLGYPSLKISRS